jgi:hypothetical protein
VISRYAVALLGQVRHALRSVPPADLGEAFAALDGFVATPRGDTYLAAVRALRAARARQASARLRGLHAGYLFRRGLEAVRALPGAGPGHAEILADLPMDARTGRRLLALAQLLEAHAELSGRAAATFRELRRKLEAASPKATPAPVWRTSGPSK